jgi:hypothetical protein
MIEVVRVSVHLKGTSFGRGPLGLDFSSVDTIYNANHS